MRACKIFKRFLTIVMKMSVLKRFKIILMSTDTFLIHTRQLQ